MIIIVCLFPLWMLSGVMSGQWFAMPSSSHVLCAWDIRDMGALNLSMLRYVWCWCSHCQLSIYDGGFRFTDILTFIHSRTVTTCWWWTSVGHWPSFLSLLCIVMVLYCIVMNHHTVFLIGYGLYGRCSVTFQWLHEGVD